MDVVSLKECHAFFSSIENMANDEEDTRVSHIHDDVWIGGEDAAKDKELILAIREDKQVPVTVINCAREIPNYFEGDPDIQYVRLNMNDANDLLIEHAPMVKEAIQRGYPTLVHCFMGMSRSCAIVIQYLMGDPLNYTADTAWALVKKRRPGASLNWFYCNQLGLPLPATSNWY